MTIFKKRLLTLSSTVNSTFFCVLYLHCYKQKRDVNEIIISNEKWKMKRKNIEILCYKFASSNVFNKIIGAYSILILSSWTFIDPSLNIVQEIAVNKLQTKWVLFNKK